MSKTILDEDEIADFHKFLVWVFHVISISTPILAGILLSLGQAGNVVLSVICVAFICGAVVATRFVALGASDKTSAPRASFTQVRTLLNSAMRTVVYGSNMPVSVVAGGGVNFLYTSAIYITVAKLTESLSTNSSNTLLPVVPLVLVALGSLGLSKVAPLKNPSAGLSLLSLIAGAVVGVVAVVSNVWMALILLPVIGYIAARTTSTVWDIRLHAAEKHNMGSLSGLTGALYKLPLLVLLPITGSLGTETNIIPLLFIVAGVSCLPAMTVLLTRRFDLNS